MAEYEDDQSVMDADDLWRRIPPWHFVKDENLGRVRPSSAAFDDDPETDEDGNRLPMSSYVARFVYGAGCGVADVLAGHANFGLACFKAGLARQNNLGVAFEAAALPGHCVVFGKKTDGVRRKLAKNSEWVVPPPEK